MRLCDSTLLLRSFVVAELFKLRRLRVAKAMIGAMVVTSPLITGITWLLLGDERTSTFPHVLELIYLPLWLLCGMVGLLLAVETMGSEFEQDTVRTLVGRGTPRWLFVWGKALALFVAVAVNAVVGTLSGGVFAIVSHLIQVGTGGLAEGLYQFVLSWLPAVGIATLSGLSYVGVLSLLVVLIRSSALAMLGGLLLFGGDFLISAMGVEGLETGAYSIYGSTSALFSRVTKGIETLGMAVKGFDDPGQAFLTLALYAIAGLALAHYIFEQQDLAGKK